MCKYEGRRSRHSGKLAQKNLLFLIKCNKNHVVLLKKTKYFFDTY